MAEQLPGLPDDAIELLRRLSTPPNPRSSHVGATSLAHALKYPSPLSGISDDEAAKPELELARKHLSQMRASKVILVEEKDGAGTFATEECQSLNPALVKITHEREIARAQAIRRQQLEWLQLASCLDKEPVAVGAYPAHAERFLLTAAHIMSQQFPWIDFRLEVVKSRTRVDRFRGTVQNDFDAGVYDYIMIPRERGPVRISPVYFYTFRVLGPSAKLAQLRDANGLINISKLRGERLILAPAGTSSRRRLHDLFLQEGIDIERDIGSLSEEPEPAAMRVRAESGEGLAITSDEYSVIGGNVPSFPRLAIGHDQQYPQAYRVEMGLLGQRSAKMPRHKAFEFVIHELISREKEQDRAAAQP